MIIVLVMNSSILILTLKKQWFDLMLSGLKKDEFRSSSDWIKSRLYNKDGSKRNYKYVKFYNGYGKDKPYFVAEYKGFSISEQNDIFVCDGNKAVIFKGDFIIHLGDIVELKEKNHEIRI